MKSRIMIISIIILCYNTLYSQDITKLDEKNGFKGLILGNSIDQVKKIVKLKEIENMKKEQLEVFTIKDPSNYTILDFKPDYINLIFFNKALMEIAIKMPDQHNLNPDNTRNNAFGTLATSIIGSLAKSYGQVYQQDENPLKPSVNFTVTWTGAKVSLIYCAYLPKRDNRGLIDSGPTLHFISNQISQKRSTITGKGGADF
jgi:hypothetical protein